MTGGVASLEMEKATRVIVERRLSWAMGVSMGRNGHMLWNNPAVHCEDGLPSLRVKMYFQAVP